MQSPRTNARRCCVSCRTKKVRCHLPDLEVPNAANSPLPAHLSCSRCRATKMACIVDDQCLKRRLKRSFPSPDIDQNSLFPMGSQLTGPTTKSSQSVDETFLLPKNFKPVPTPRVAAEATPEQPVRSYSHKRRCISALESLPMRGGLREASPDDLTILDQGTPRLPQRSYRRPSLHSAGETETIRYLHRPLDAFGQLLSLDLGFQEYIQARYRDCSGHDSQPVSSIRDVISLQLCEELEPLLQPLLAFSPYIPPLAMVFRSSQTRSSLPTDLLLAVLCALALRHLPARSELSRLMDGFIDELGTTALLSLSPTPETVIALLLLLTYEPAAFCSSSLRFGPLKGSAIIGQPLLTSAVSAARSLGFHQAELSQQKEACSTTELQLCDQAARVAVWWALSAWEAHFAFNRSPFRPHSLAREALSASSYLQAPPASVPSPADLCRQDGRRFLAHRILTLAEVHSAIQRLEDLCTRAGGVTTEGQLAEAADPLSTIRTDAQDLCRRTQLRLTELEASRASDISHDGLSSRAEFMEAWLSLEQNSIHSLFLSKVACAGVMGSTELILPLPAFIQSIRSDTTTATWLEEPGRARRDTAESTLGIFCGLGQGSEWSPKPGTIRLIQQESLGGSRLYDLLNDRMKTGQTEAKSEKPRIPYADYLWAVSPILTNALLLDSCRMLLEAEAFTLMMSRQHLPRRECLMAQVRQAAARLRQSYSFQCGSRRSLDRSDTIPAGEHPVQICMAGMLDDMLESMTQWHRHRRLRNAKCPTLSVSDSALPIPSDEHTASSPAITGPRATFQQMAAEPPSSSSSQQQVHFGHLLPTSMSLPEYPADARMGDSQPAHNDRLLDVSPMNASPAMAMHNHLDMGPLQSVSTQWPGVESSDEAASWIDLLLWPGSPWYG